MATVTVTIPPADVPRVQATATALGYTTLHEFVVGVIEQQVKGWESQTHQPDDTGITAK